MPGLPDAGRDITPGLHCELSGLAGSPGWARLQSGGGSQDPGCGHGWGDPVSWPKGPEPAREVPKWGARTAEWPLRPVLSPGSGKSLVFTRAQQVGVDSTRRREPETPGVRRRSEGRSPPGRTRPSGARCAPGQQQGPKPGFGRGPPSARASLSRRVSRSAVELFPVLLARKECLCWGNIGFV